MGLFDLGGLLGGGSTKGIEANKSNQTTTNTTSVYTDSRSVVDAGGGIVGSGNFWDQSTTNSTSFADNSQSWNSSVSQDFADYSDRRVDASQSFTDNSDRSQSFTDNSDRSLSFSDSSDRSQSFSDYSDRSVDASQQFSDYSDRSLSFSDESDRSVSITTDGNAFDIVERMGMAQADLARDIASRATTGSNEALQLAYEAQERASGFNEDALSGAFDLSGQAQRFAQTSSDAALSFARGTYDQAIGMAQEVVKQAGENAAQAATVAQGAYQSAADTASGNKTLIYVAIGAVVLVGGLVALKS